MIYVMQVYENFFLLLHVSVKKLCFIINSKKSIVSQTEQDICLHYWLVPQID